MGVQRFLLWSALALLVTASAGGSATRPYPGSASWADSRHGWAPNHQRLCERTLGATADSSLCATEDGGRTWREIFSGGNYIFTALRTSVGAGVVSTGAYGHFELWTRDNGAHWYGLSLPGVDSSTATQPWFAGKGDQLYFVRTHGDTVYRLTPWPPPGPATCEGTWSRSFADGPDPNGNLCAGPAVAAGTSSEPVLSVPGTISWLGRVPEGVFTLFWRAGDQALATAVHRAGANTIRDLPVPSVPVDTSGSLPTVRIAWPSITLSGRYASGGAGTPTWQVLWRSNDGGATWKVDVRSAWVQHSFDPVPRAGAATGVLGEDVILAGGATSELRGGRVATVMASQLVQAYRPADDSWRTQPALPVAVARAAGASSGGAFYVVGGFDRAGRPTRGVVALRGNAWEHLPALPAARAAAGTAILRGKLYVVGGLGARGLARNMLVLDLRSRRWSTLPGPRPRAYLGVASAGSRLFALGGRTGRVETSLALAEAWRPGDRRWRRLPPLPSRRSDTAAVALGDSVVSIGGASTEFYLPVGAADLLDPSNGRWLRLPELGTARYGLSTAAIGNTIYALLGGDGDGPTDRGTMNEWLLVDR